MTLFKVGVANSSEMEKEGSRGDEEVEAEAGRSEGEGCEDEVHLLAENVVSIEQMKVVAWSTEKATSEVESDVFNSVRKVKMGAKKETEMLNNRSDKGKKHSNKEKDVGKTLKLTVRQIALAAAKDKRKEKSRSIHNESVEDMKKAAVEASKVRFQETLAKERPLLKNMVGSTRVGALGVQSQIESQVGVVDLQGPKVVFNCFNECVKVLKFFFNRFL